VVIILENHEYSSVIGSSDAPYLNKLASRYVLLTGSYAITHPSLPNYLALTGGSTFGISSDCTTCSVHRSNLVDQLERAGVSWKAYMEDLPHRCFLGATSDGYAKKHDPFLYYDDIREDPSRCRLVVPLHRLDADLAAGALPQFAWITPNLCHDMHDCSVATGDAWLKTWVRKILPALGTDGILIVTFDEGTTDAGCCDVAAGGHVSTIIAGLGAAKSTELSAPVDNCSLRQLIGEAFGRRLLRSAATAPQIAGYQR